MEVLERFPMIALFSLRRGPQKAPRISQERLQRYTLFLTGSHIPKNQSTPAEFFREEQDHPLRMRTG